MMDILDALKPSQAAVVDVVCLVVEYSEFVDLAHDLAKVSIAVVGLANRLRAERGKKIVAQITIVERWLRHVAKIDSMNVGQKEIACRAHDAHIVLNVQSDLKIITPVAAGMSIIRQHRVIKEYAQPVEIGQQAVEHDDVRRDQQKITRQHRINLVELVKVAPGNQ